MKQNKKRIFQRLWQKKKLILSLLVQIILARGSPKNGESKAPKSHLVHESLNDGLQKISLDDGSHEASKSINLVFQGM